MTTHNSQHRRELLRNMVWGLGSGPIPPPIQEYYHLTSKELPEQSEETGLRESQIWSKVTEPSSAGLATCTCSQVAACP